MNKPDGNRRLCVAIQAEFKTALRTSVKQEQLTRAPVSNAEEWSTQRRTQISESQGCAPACAHTHSTHTAHR